MKLPRAADAGKRGLGLPSPNELVPARGRGQPPETATVGVSLVTGLQPVHRNNEHGGLSACAHVVDCPLYDDRSCGPDALPRLPFW